MAKKVGILGSGPVAQALGNGFIKHGYTVVLGSPHASKLDEWKGKAGSNASVGSYEDAAKADLVVLAVKGTAAEGVVESVAAHIGGKTVIDTTNPITLSPPVNGVLKYFTDINESLMERLQKAVPSANFVKAFNSVGNHLMVNPQFSEGKPTMFIAGNNPAAKKEVSSVLELFGWEIADMGKVEAARAIEPLCMLWCIPDLLSKQRGHAFKLLKV